MRAEKATRPKIRSWLANRAGRHRAAGSGHGVVAPARAVEDVVGDVDVAAEGALGVVGGLAPAPALDDDLQVGKCVPAGRFRHGMVVEDACLPRYGIKQPVGCKVGAKVSGQCKIPNEIN